jgi:hypothetical protein
VTRAVGLKCCGRFSRHGKITRKKIVTCVSAFLRRNSNVSVSKKLPRTKKTIDTSCKTDIDDMAALWKREFPKANTDEKRAALGVALVKIASDDNKIVDSFESTALNDYAQKLGGR